jgi:NADH pyrophosphatase NudC (nudix superfamily)/nicotinamide mononucleotide (NMN) deamidase PncC
MKLFGVSRSTTTGSGTAGSSTGRTINNNSNHYNSNTGSNSNSNNNKYLQSFIQLVATLRHTKSSITCIEQSCGGLISSSILMQPGASSVYYGSSIVYNTKQCKALLLNNDTLYESLIHQKIHKNNNTNDTLLMNSTGTSSKYNKDLLLYDGTNVDIINALQDETVREYIQSKIYWTTQTAIQYCTTLQTDYAIAEGGAVGPTFNYHPLHTGFTVVTIAGRRRKLQQPQQVHTIDSNDNDSNNEVVVLRQEVVYSNHSNRIQNMYSFAQTAAGICTSVIQEQQQQQQQEQHQNDNNNIDSHDNHETAITNSQQLSSHHHPDSSMRYKFDRASHLRTNHSTLQYLQHVSEHTKFIILYKKQILININTTNHNHQSDTTISSNSNSYNSVAYLNRNELQQLFNIHIISTDKKNVDRISSTSFLGILQQQAQEQEQQSDVELSIPQQREKDMIESVFVIDLHPEYYKDNESLNTLETYTFVDTRSTLPLLQQHSIDIEIILYGTALVEWKRTMRYCNKCGSSTIEYIDGGTVGQCQSCNMKFWPRQDPSIIVLIVSRNRQRVLLANHVRHLHKKIYTTLAGFVEVGETFEQAVIREVNEETGISIDRNSIQYIGSQPWPFPQSCMIGFIATADDTKQNITIDPNEIYDAQWFTKDDISLASNVVGSTLQQHVTEMAMQQNPNLKCVIPPQGVIARQLIDLWLYEDSEHPQLLLVDTSAVDDNDTNKQQKQVGSIHRTRLV